jgi:small subunit ribosomal protein S6
MRHYETIYIMNPNLGDEEYQEVLGKFNNFIQENKGVIIKTREWGKQRLAYLIQKFNYGSYVLIEYCANAGLTAGLERAFKLDDRILKCQTVKLSDKADPEALLQKEKEAREKSAAEVKAIEETAEEETAMESIESEVENGVSEE